MSAKRKARRAKTRMRRTSTKMTRMMWRMSAKRKARRRRTRRTLTTRRMSKRLVLVGSGKSDMRNCEEGNFLCGKWPARNESGQWLVNGYE